MKVSFELSPNDIRYFRERLQRVREGSSAHDEATVIRLAENLASGFGPVYNVGERIEGQGRRGFGLRRGLPALRNARRAPRPVRAT